VYHKLHAEGLAGTLTPSLVGQTTLSDLPLCFKVETEDNHQVLRLSFINGETLGGQNCDAIQARLEKVLESLHDVGIVHGDLRESNFLQREDGRVLLIDFCNAVIRKGAGDWRWLQRRMHDHSQLRGMIQRLRILAELEEERRKVPKDERRLAILLAQTADPQCWLKSECSLLGLLERTSEPPLTLLGKLEIQLELALVRWELQRDDYNKILDGAIGEATREEPLTADISLILARLYRARSMVARGTAPARLAHREAVKQCAELVGKGHDMTLAAQVDLAEQLLLFDETREAEEWLLDAMDVYKRDRDRYVREWCACLKTLSSVYYLTERRHLVRQLYLEEVETAGMTDGRFDILVRQPELPHPIL
jgi:hypothetical protein